MYVYHIFHDNCLPYRSQIIFNECTAYYCKITNNFNLRVLLKVGDSQGDFLRQI